MLVLSSQINKYIAVGYGVSNVTLQIHGTVLHGAYDGAARYIANSASVTIQA